jgi:hypothetical protein
MTLPYTIDNHFVFGYNNVPFLEKKNINTDKFFCSYSRCSRMPGSFKEECILTAKQVVNQAAQLSRTPYIFLSGGLDSEVVVKSFLESGSSFKTISFRFTNNLSSHESFYIDKFVKKHNLDHRYYDIDPDWLISTDAELYFQQAQCVMSEMLPHMKLLSHVWNNLNGFPVLGNGDLYVSKDISVDWIFDRTKPKYEWNYIEFEYIVAWNRYCVKNSILGCLGFFMHNPEIVLAMINEPIMTKCLDNKLMHKMSSRSTKTIVYLKHWQDLELRVKYHGSEQLGGRCIDLNRKYYIKFKSTNKWSIPIKQFKEMLIPNDQTT